jgi:hypothetical protein
VRYRLTNPLHTDRIGFTESERRFAAGERERYPDKYSPKLYSISLLWQRSPLFLPAVFFSADAETVQILHGACIGRSNPVRDCQIQERDT